MYESLLWKGEIYTRVAPEVRVYRYSPNDYPVNRQAV